MAVVTDIAPESIAIPQRSSTRRRHYTWLAILACALVGVGLRVFVLTHSLGALDSDEAVVGLMARRILQGHVTTFFWGQAYGGTLEPLLSAGLLWLFGPSIVALKLVPVALDVVATVLLWRVGRRLLGERAGVVAALAFWVWPATYVWWSTKARDFYGAVLVLGLIMILCAVRLAERDDRWADWLVLGLAGGLGWWTSPLVVVLAVPAVLWLWLLNRRALRRIWLAVPPAILGATPWLVWNLGHHFDSLRPQYSPESYGGHLLRFVQEALPMSLGLRIPYMNRWLSPGAKVAYVGLLVLGFVVLRERPSRGSLALLLAILIYPFVWALNPMVWVTAEGRYLFLLAPLLALTIGYGAVRRWTRVVVFAVLLVLTAGGLTTMQHGLVGLDVDRPVPVHMGPLVNALDRRGVRDVFSTYWVAYRLDYQSNERITATPLVGQSRSRQIEATVRTSALPAYVFVDGSVNDKIAGDGFRTLGVAVDHLSAGGFSVFIPQHKVLPEQLPAFEDNP